VVEVWTATHVGCRRPVNEDALCAEELAGGRAWLLTVADGMGGHAGGEIASRVAVGSLAGHVKAALRDGALPGTGAARSLLAEAVSGANRAVCGAAADGAGPVGMGTTLVAVLVTEGWATVAHVGDSRAYLFRSGNLRRLTEDHSLVAALVRTGDLAEDQVSHHPQRHVLTKALGGSRGARADMTQLELQPGDLIMLCSDGLTGPVGEEELAAVLSEAAARDAVDQAPERLVELANSRGGPDNVTIVLARF